MSSILGAITLPEQLTLGYAIGRAAGGALEPFLIELENEANKTAVSAGESRPPTIYTTVQGVAQGQIAEATAREWAHEQGYGDEVFDALVAAADNGPALGEAIVAWRRGKLTETEFETALNRAAIEKRWWPALKNLKEARLDIGAIATAVHRGIMSDAGLLVTKVPSGQGVVPRIPESSLDTLAEFEAQGIDPERARVLVADTGLPLSLGEMLRLLNMGEVTATDVQVSVAESNVRNEYMDVALKLARHLLTAHEWAEAELRGIKTHAEAQAGAGMVGLEPQDYDTLFEILGRPLSVHDITKALAHGVDLGGTYTDIPEPYRDAVRRSAIRPEYARLAYANRYTYPSAFVLRSLTQTGEITEQDAHTILLFEGWEPTLAAKVAAAWAAPTGTKADPWLAKADQQLWTKLHKTYVGGTLDPALVDADFDLIGVHPDVRPEILARWDAEKVL